MTALPKIHCADPYALAIARAAQNAVAPATVILFGSRATSRHRPDSDVDLMVLTQAGDPHQAAQKARRAARKYMAQNPPWLPVNAIGFPWPEFRRYSQAGLHITGQAARFGVFMTSESPEPSCSASVPTPDGYPAHWPATSQRIRNALRYKDDLAVMAEHAIISLELFGFTAQQSVENALKGWLSTYDLSRDYGHDLLELWEDIVEIETAESDTSPVALNETAELFMFITLENAAEPTDWLSKYAVTYRYHGVTYASDEAQRLAFARRVAVTIDAIVAHIYHRSGVNSQDPKALSH